VQLISILAPWVVDIDELERNWHAVLFVFPRAPAYLYFNLLFNQRAARIKMNVSLEKLRSSTTSTFIFQFQIANDDISSGTNVFHLELFAPRVEQRESQYALRPCKKKEM
jgi:hypothetical protein